MGYDTFTLAALRKWTHLLSPETEKLVWLWPGGAGPRGTVAPSCCRLARGAAHPQHAWGRDAGRESGARPGPHGVSTATLWGVRRSPHDRLADQPARRTHEGHCEGPGHSPPARPAERRPPCPLPAAGRAQPRAPRHGGTRPLWPLWSSHRPAAAAPSGHGGQRAGGAPHGSPFRRASPRGRLPSERPPPASASASASDTRGPRLCWAPRRLLTPCVAALPRAAVRGAPTCCTDTTGLPGACGHRARLAVRELGGGPHPSLRPQPPGLRCRGEPGG